MITTLPIRLVLRAPFVTRSSDSGDVGVDLPLARAANGTVMIPGSHVIGKLAAAWRELCELLGDDPAGEQLRKDLVTLFGSKDINSTGPEELQSDGREARRRLTASDFRLISQKGQARTRTRIAIDNVRATVLDGMLQVIEQPFATAEELVFEGKLRVVGGASEAQGNSVIKALQFVTQMGALRTAGYGEVVDATSHNMQHAQPRSEPIEGTKRVLARLRFEDVFCAGEARNSPNTYVSADHVPGGVIKGAIARQMLASVGRSGFLDDPANRKMFDGNLLALAEVFSQIRVRHAQPVAKGDSNRPFRFIPDSLAAIGDGAGDPVIVDLAGLDDPAAPVLIDGQTPVAPFDWKNAQWDKANALLGVRDGPGRVLRVRTQVSDDTRAAMASRLFGVEYTRGDTHDFLAEIDFSACIAPEAAIRGLETVVVDGLAGIGRGGAFAEVNLSPLLTGHGATPKKRIVAVLQSAALLRDPSRPAVDLRQAYADAFAELGLPPNIELKAIFVREKLAGGSFFRARLARRERAYAPWLLTEPGATFVFESTHGKTIDPSLLFPHGLAVPPSVLNHHGIDDLDDLYRVCPYLPQNGYGDLVIDPFIIEGRPLWQARAPEALGLVVEAVGALPIVWGA